MQFLKISLSETTRPRAFKFGISHHLEVLYQSCSTYASGVKIDPAPGVTLFSSPEHKVLMVSYCDRALSVVVRRPSSVVRKLFSSPEHKVLRVSYCDRPLSVVRRRASCVVRRASCVNFFT